MTTSTAETRERAAPHISYPEDDGGANEYATNIQVADPRGAQRGPLAGDGGRLLAARALRGGRPGRRSAAGPAPFELEKLDPLLTELLETRATRARHAAGRGSHLGAGAVAPARLCGAFRRYDSCVPRLDLVKSTANLAQSARHRLKPTRISLDPDAPAERRSAFNRTS